MDAETCHHPRCLRTSAYALWPRAVRVPNAPKPGGHDGRVRDKGSDRAGTIRVRPFAQRIEGVRPGATLDVRGFVRGGAFVVAVLHREFELQARAIDSDGCGVYAVLEESEQRLDFGAVLRIATEYQADTP